MADNDAKASANANPAPTDQYLSAVDRTRETSKWLIGAFAAVAGIVLAGVQITGLGKLDGWDLFFAISSVVGALFGAGLAIYGCARVLTPAQVTLSELVKNTKVADALASDPILKGYATSATELKDKFELALAEYHRAWNVEGADKPGTPENQYALKAQQQLISISGAADSALRFAAWKKVDDAFLTAKRLMAVGAAIALAGIIAFTYLANKPDEMSPGTADVTDAKLVHVSFTEDAASGWKSVLGKKCDLENVAAILIASDTDKQQVELASLPNQGCQARHFKLGDEEGLTIDDKDVELPAGLRSP
jgi:hypothetical protein